MVVDNNDVSNYDSCDQRSIYLDSLDNLYNIRSHNEQRVKHSSNKEILNSSWNNNIIKQFLDISDVYGFEIRDIYSKQQSI